MATRPPHLLCPSCAGALVANRGQRCRRCDQPAGLACCCGQGAGLAPAFLRLRAPYLFAGALQPMVKALKYHGRLEVAGGLAQLIWADEGARQLLAEAEALVPVPMAWSRRLSRGYNHSAMLARRLGRLSGRPVRHLLRRCASGPRQAGAGGRRQRAANIRGAFAARRPAAGRLLLIDDVATTGQTAAAAVATLVAAGAAQVAVLTAARTPGPGSSAEPTGGGPRSPSSLWAPAPAPAEAHP